MTSFTIKPNTQETRLQVIDEESTGEYVVQENAELTLVLTSKGNKTLEGSAHVRLVGVNAHVKILGVFLNAGSHELKLHTLQHHEALGTTSNLLVKSVLTDTSTFSYDGAIRVEKEGQKTDAYQRNENLLLSPDSHAQSKPSLEILADDVRCTHGATIGTIDQEQLFYLSSRGIGAFQGKQLIVQGFLDSVVSEISDTIVAEKVKEILWQTLPKQL